MIKCVYCNKETSNLNHSCRTKRHIEKILPFEELLYKFFLEEKRPIYYVQQNSMVWAGFQVRGNTLRQWCKINNVPTLTIKEAANTKFTREKYKNTLLTVYGVDNISKSDLIKEKKILINQTRYGVDNQFQRPEIVIKSKQTLLQKFGVENARYIPRSASNTVLTKPHKKISNYLISINIEHENEMPNLFPKPRSSNNRIYSPIVDIWVESHNLVIEIYGDYWHANPKMYFAEDLIALFTGPTLASEIWKLNDMRETHIKSFGVDTLILWESDIRESFDTVKTLIHNKLEQCMEKLKNGKNKPD